MSKAQLWDHHLWLRETAYALKMRGDAEYHVWVVRAALALRYWKRACNNK